MIDWSRLDGAGVVAMRAAIDAEIANHRGDLPLTVVDAMMALNEAQNASSGEDDDAVTLFRAGVFFVVGFLITLARQRANDTEFYEDLEKRILEYTIVDTVLQ